jgi:putative phage-type endonuclease
MTITSEIPQAVHVGSYEPGSPQWRELRQFKLGGSDISAVLGFSAYESHLSLWLRKKGLAEPRSGDELTEWGNRLERAIFDKFVENHPGIDWIYQPGSFVSPERDWHLASPDAISPNHSTLVEVKTVQNEYEWGEPPHGAIPLGYRCQVLWNMSATGADHAWVPALIRGCTYREYLVERDDAAEADIAILLDAGQRFIQSLKDDQAPDIDGHDQTYRVLREMHPEIDAIDIEIPQDLADAYIAAVLQERETKAIRQKWAGEIMQLMGRARNALDGNGQRVAFRKPASNAERIPYLCVDPALMRSLKTATISGAIAADQHLVDNKPGYEGEHQT